MLILDDVLKYCSDASLARVLGIAKRILDMLQIVGPILCIISCIYIFIKMMINPEDKKLPKNLRNAFFALAITFFIPVFVNVTMQLFDDKFTISNCWNYAEEVANVGGVSYMEISEETRKSILNNPSDYENSSSNSSNGSSSTSNNNNSSNSTSNSTSSKKGPAVSVKIQYNKKDSGGRCGKGSGDKCVEIATVKYQNGDSVKFYMGYQNNSQLLGGSCRAHAFTCGMNAVNNTKYSTIDLQNYMKSLNGDGVFKGKTKYNAAISHFNVNAKAYFNETSISKSYSLAKSALDNGQPVMIFVSGNKCSDLANSHHALLLLGYDSNDNVIFLDSCGRYKNAKKRNLSQLINGCMSPDGIAKNWMRMVIFSY